MATSLPMPNETTSIKPSSLQEQEPDEHTSLLGSHRGNDSKWTPAIHSAPLPHEQDAPRPVDEEATGVFESIHGERHSELATGIVGVISVLLLGIISPITSMLWRGPTCSHFWAGHRCLHRKRRYLDCSCNIQHDLVGFG